MAIHPAALGIFAVCCTMITSVASSTEVATPIAYETLADESEGDATPKHLFGRRVAVKATRYSDLGFRTSAKPAWLAFVCESGDPGLVATRRGQRLKPATFSGTTRKAQGWEGATVWSLSDCRYASAPGR